MAQPRIRLSVAAGAVVSAGALLAGCGGSAARHAAGGPAATATTATTVPASTVAPSSVPASSVPATTAPVDTTAPTATTVAPTSTPAATGPLLVVPGSGGAPGYQGREPSTIDFSGDSTNIVTHLTWTSWGPSTATGRGSIGLNNCQPNCAQGTVTQVAASIDLGAVVSGHFTSMTETAPGLDRTYSYPSNWALGAS